MLQFRVLGGGGHCEIVLALVLTFHFFYSATSPTIIIFQYYSDQLYATVNLQ